MPPGARVSRWVTSTAAISPCDRKLASLDFLSAVFGGSHDEQQRARGYQAQHETRTVGEERADYHGRHRRVKKQAEKCGSKIRRAPVSATNLGAAFDADPLFSCQQAIAIQAAFHRVLSVCCK